jgi:4-diphosphocytidyl-2-C-methyl-D-erythritol kinase
MVVEKAYAKINVFLNVIKKRLDGYHELEMAMVPLKLHDTLKFSIILEDKVELICEEGITEHIKDNLVYKVASFVKEEFSIKDGIKIILEKRIPSGAGLGGGSADAAATLRGLNKLFKLKLDDEKMAELGALFGADVPFCVYNKPAFVTGIGDKIQILNTKFKTNVLLIKPEASINTKKVFENLDPSQFKKKTAIDMIEAIKNNDYSAVINNLYNYLERTTFEISPIVKKTKEDLIEIMHKGVLMSGSGSTVFALSKNKKQLKVAEKVLNKGYNTILTKTF